MKTVKTLTINGQEYVVQDPSAVSVDPMQLDEEKQKQARSNIGAVGVPEVDSAAAKLINDKSVSPKSVWSSQNTVDKLCPAFTESGAVVTCEPVEGYPLEVVSHIQPGQAGSGDPSLDNIRLIVGHNEIKLTHCGKNFLDKSQIVIGGMVGTNGEDWDTYTRMRTGYIPVVPGRTYVVSGNSLLVSRIHYYDSNKAWLGLNMDVTQFTTSERTRYVRIAFAGTDSAFTEDDLASFKEEPIQMEMGTTATPYEPYRGDTFSLDLGQTVYGGSYNWKTGELTITHGFYTMTGQETYSRYNNFFIAYNDGAFKASVANEGLCSHGLYANYRTGCWCVNGAVIYVPNGNYGLDNTGLQVFQEDMATWYELGYPVQLCYKLAQPITIQATPQEVLAEQGVNTLFSNTGDTTVTGRADTLALIKKLQNSIAAVETALANNT